ncbi:hypothetical protein GOBAR_AA28011 [Gossypium barbadense]|uniref:START domain-containing protein n=1 Tax=Gossypium barbadense TaxID=3634 RepID=A0A2P5WNR1_GOSBA|nr:hypothetical protein GOBAR_AA28011 [Gossypium barbadense]
MALNQMAALKVGLCLLAFHGRISSLQPHFQHLPTLPLRLLLSASSHNPRCREKQRKEASRLQTVNRKLTAMNKLLMEENDRLFSIAEETLTEFLSKATGTAIEWVQMPGMKPGLDSIGIVAISHGRSGVAARACGLVGLDPTRVAKILKDRPSWYRDCQAVDVINVLSTGNGGTIELLYMQFWRPGVTHVIASTDENGACTRTLKVLMAILNGKWVLKLNSLDLDE